MSIVPGTILVQSSGPDFSANINRVMPGKIDGTVTERYAARLWNYLYGGNADLVIDVHVQSRGTEYPMFVYFDQRQPDSRRMAEHVGADAIKIDSGEMGSVETTFDEAKIPAITFEIGSADVYQRKMIDRAVAGIRNVMFSCGMITDMPAAARPAFEGNDFTNVKAAVCGLAEITVKLGEMVAKDQPVAIQRDLFGDTLKQYNAPHDGYVLSVATNPVREPGAMLVRVLRMNADPKCKDGC
jgi:predicted deacylase